MIYPYSILMFIFAGVLVLYGLLCIRTGDPNLLSLRGRKAAKRTREHVRNVGKTVVLVACAPLLSGI